jgi:AraC-like DNA-binding protein
LNESDLDHTSSYREWAPPAAWSHAVACCWEQRVGAARVQRVLPDACADVIVCDSGSIDVVGLFDEVSTPVLAAGTAIQGIRFRPEAVAAVFGVDAASLRNRTVALDDVVGTRRARRVLDGEALDAWIRAVEPDGRTAAALQLLRDHPVALASARVGISPRQLQRLLHTHAGVGPKTYQRVVRLQRFLSVVEGGDGLAVAAAEAGYADQAHMSREVRRLSGLTPTELLAERGTTAA